MFPPGNIRTFFQVTNYFIPLCLSFGDMAGESERSPRCQGPSQRWGASHPNNVVIISPLAPSSILSATLREMFAYVLDNLVGLHMITAHCALSTHLFGLRTIPDMQTVYQEQLDSSTHQKMRHKITRLDDCNNMLSSPDNRA